VGAWSYQEKQMKAEQNNSAPLQFPRRKPQSFGTANVMDPFSCMPPRQGEALRRAATLMRLRADDPVRLPYFPGNMFRAQLLFTPVITACS